MLKIIKFTDLNLIKVSHCSDQLYLKNNYILLCLPKNSLQGQPGGSDG